jgi:molybdopterin converting factor small subunit
MNILVRLIGRYRTYVGEESMALTLPPGSTVLDLVDAFVALYPEADKDKKNLLVSRDTQFLPRQTVLHDGDELTVAPPVVSGG